MGQCLQMSFMLPGSLTRLSTDLVKVKGDELGYSSQKTKQGKKVDRQKVLKTQYTRKKKKQPDHISQSKVYTREP
ncbi:unnamed protein product [Paramecium pentaurelia]|uniref:Uncharacterized protein n=1 Tax=Paramecium pentaurelia TaxID=43138 RepID=A0A8S1TY39_9CILI|nr:unnamed protein product [Paramecium pentaurelia]